MLKKFLFFITLIFSVLFTVAQTFSQHQGDQPYAVSYAQIQPGVHQITFEVLNVDVEDVTLNGAAYSRIYLGNARVIEQKGWAELPFISASIQLPNDRDVNLEVSTPNAVSIQLANPMVPSRGTIYRNQDPNTIPYEIAPESRTSRLYPENVATMESPFIVRDVRGTTVRVSPFRYNGATQTLEYYRTVTVTLRETNRPATNPLTRTDLRPTREAIGMYQSLFLNYEPTRQDLAQGEKGDILVLTPSAYEGAADLYIQWKKEMGYNVSKQVVSSGANVASTIQNEYNANGNLMYVQLFGDWADIKSNTITVDYSAAPADPKMGCVAGNDNHPDIAIGRFSCSSNAQALVQVNKAINYEKTPNMDAGWRETFIGIGSAEGSGTGDDGEIDYTHIQRIFSERLQSFTYVTEKGNYGNNASASTLAGHVNGGASTIAYCGHGDETYFVTTNYSNTNVNASTNGDKLPFIVSVACVNGKFNRSGGDCFAEAWLKKENGGAVVTLMSTINQPWTPPQRGQDYFYDILVGGFNYNQYSGQSGINTNEQRTHWGSIVVNAFTLALTESSASDDLETFQTWTTFGDASLQLRTKQPDALILSSRNLMSGIPFTTTVTANGQPVADALVCISQNGNYYSAYTAADGTVSIPHEFVSGDVLLVVTAFNTTTLYETISCTASDVPYLTLTGYTPEIVSAGETPFLTLSMSNLGGIATTGNATVTLTCNDPLLTVTDGTGYATPMAALNGTCTLNNEFQVSINANTETGHEFIMTWTATYENYSWDGTFRLTAVGSDCVTPDGLAGADNGSNAVLTWNDNSTEQQITITDDVEGHTYGTINSPGSVGWTYIDGDGASTGTFQNVSYTNAGSAMAFIVLDDEQMTGSSIVEAHSGDKYFGSAYAKSSGWGSTAQNNDWMISPELNFSEPFTFSFWARSYSSSYSAEQFYAAYSTTGTNEDNFVNLNSSATTTTTTWTEYTYTVPANAKHVAIHCVSNDQYIFCVDDITISGRQINGPACNIYRNGELIAEHVAGGTFTDQNLPAGTYCYTITRDCGSGFESLASESVCVTIGNPVTEPCDVPTGLTANTSSNQIGLSWNAVSNAIAYKVYRNGNAIATVQTNSYTDANVTAGTTYAYAVKTVCTGGESELSSTVNGTATTDINSYDGSEVRIYPNPTHNMLNIEGDNLKEVSLYSAIGTLVQKTEATEKTVTLNVSTLTKGIYFVKIMTSEGNISTRKVVVE